MTDNEIIKTLEGMINKYNSKFLDEVLDLINRQQEEIEALVAGQETLQKFVTLITS